MVRSRILARTLDPFDGTVPTSRSRSSRSGFRLGSPLLQDPGVAVGIGEIGERAVVAALRISWMKMLADDLAWWTAALAAGRERDATV
jgi:hypothetical protein